MGEIPLFESDDDNRKPPETQARARARDKELKAKTEETKETTTKSGCQGCGD